MQAPTKGNVSELTQSRLSLHLYLSLMRSRRALLHRDTYARTRSPQTKTQKHIHIHTRTCAFYPRMPHGMTTELCREVAISGLIRDARPMRSPAHRDYGTPHRLLRPLLKAVHVVVFALKSIETQL